jgi:ABC-type nitrate/sulfonate/bicarbonate transport system substrate-binding protein
MSKYHDSHLLEVGTQVFRAKEDNETIEEYRKKVAEHLYDTDPIRAHEIAVGISWDEWKDDHFVALLLHKPELVKRFVMVYYKACDLHNRNKISDELWKKLQPS